MDIIDQKLKNLEVDELKNHIKRKIIEYNDYFNEINLNSFINFIDDTEIDIDRDGYSFSKTDNDTFEVYSRMTFIYTGKENSAYELLAEAINTICPLTCFRFRDNKDGTKTYVLHFNYAFRHMYKRDYCYDFGGLSFDELVKHVNDNFGGFYDRIYELSSENKPLGKVICTDNYSSVYKIDFGEYGIYIGHSKNVKSRMSGHRGQANKGKHCYTLNELYKNNRQLFNDALKNVTIIERPIYLDKERRNNYIQNLEYHYQVEALRNGEKLLGRQCWDEDFRSYLAYNVDEYEYQELLAKSFQINKDPNKHTGYSTYNPFAKRIQSRQMDYKDVVRYFEELRKEHESS